MPFDGFDTAAIARALDQIADQPEDLVDAYFERLEDIELPAGDRAPGLKLRREEGLAVRLVRGGRTWLAARDAIEPGAFAEALRQVARALPMAPYPEPALPLEPWGPAAAPELYGFPAAVEREVRRRHAAFPVRLSVKRHRRSVQVVGPRLSAGLENEVFYSLVAELDWQGRAGGGHFGALLPALTAREAGEVAAALVGRFRARQAPPPAPGHLAAVLAPAAAAVLLHEAVAHALETDLLALSGNPESAVGVTLGSAELNVLDDPGNAPGKTRRRTDDEGSPVCRRWLLRGGVVEQPLADSLAARSSTVLAPGAARRGSRHLPPGPRSTHLELLAGGATEEDLLAGAEGGLFVPEASRGKLDPLSGRFTLWIPHARRVRGGVVADAVGPFRLRGSVADLLSAVRGVGRLSAAAGAGWCAKGGQTLPVWATTPSLWLEGAEVSP